MENTNECVLFLFWQMQPRISVLKVRDNIIARSSQIGGM